MYISLILLSILPEKESSNVSLAINYQIRCSGSGSELGKEKKKKKEEGTYENAIEFPDLRNVSSSQSRRTPIVALVNDFLQAAHASLNPSCAKPFPSDLHHGTLLCGESTHLGHAIAMVSEGEDSMGWLYGTPASDSKL
jgi:hypothetical protein